MSLPRNGPALYVDSDILFFAGATDIIQKLSETRAPALYLKDCLNYSFDPRIFRDPIESLHPVNAGLLLVLRPLDWSLGIERRLEPPGILVILDLPWNSRLG